MKKIFSVLLICILSAFILAGCSKDGQTAADTTNADVKPAGEAESKPEDTAPEKEDSGKSLAKRLCGKYSYHSEGTSDDDKYYILNVVSFGDNLYALCGEAMAEEGAEPDQLEAYSFWASEFIPFDANEMKSVDSDTVKVNELCFSIMSNLSKYWNSGCEGTITYTDEGLLFEGFGDDFLSSSNESRLFVKDERVEDVFAYAEGGSRAGDGELEGLWSRTENGVTVYIDFRGSDMFIYLKSPEEEVYFAGGAYKCVDDNINTTMSVLGWGDMPQEAEISYEVRGDRLKLAFDENANSIIAGTHLYKRADESDVHVISMDEVVFNEDSFGPAGAADATDGSGYSEIPPEPAEFYGVFITSAKEEEQCDKSLDKLDEAGFHDSVVIFTPDFTELNQDPYYVVSSGKFKTKEEAEARLKEIKAAGFNDAYVKYTGVCKNNHVYYYMYGADGIRITDDGILIEGVMVTVPYGDLDGTVMNLVVDENARFADTCDFTGFGNYEEGDTPYKWITRNYEFLKNESDEYFANGPALAGVFEVSLDGNRVREYYGCYWWD